MLIILVSTLAPTSSQLEVTLEPEIKESLIVIDTTYLTKSTTRRKEHSIEIQKLGTNF